MRGFNINNQLDTIVIAFYFLLIFFVGITFRRFIKTSSDYFRGGARVTWWLSGASIFMVSFSAWTFTGAAGKAYQDGWPIIVIYLCNTISLTVCGLYFSGKFRNLRVITPIQAIGERFGPINETIFTWLQMPIGLLQAAIWLNALGVIGSTVSNISVDMTIFVSGSIILFVALIGGSWAIVASEFLQVLILLPVCIVLAILSLVEVGGLNSLTRAVPTDNLNLSKIFSCEFLPLWCFAIILKQFFYHNNLMSSSKFFCVKDHVHASRAAFFAASLCFVGATVWFIPPMAASVLFPDLSNAFPSLPNPSEGSYIAIAINLLPAGMLGLLISGIFSATMSSVDSGLSYNSAIFVKNLYQPKLNPNAKENHVLLIGKLCTFAMGVLIMVIAWKLTHMKDFSLFNITLKLGGLVTVPISIPLFWAMIIKKSPEWACWSTLLACCLVSISSEVFFTEAWIYSQFQYANIDRESLEYFDQGAPIILNIIIGSAWFLGCCVFSKKQPEEHRRRAIKFFEKTATPVNFEMEIGNDNSYQQRRVIGTFSLISGSFILFLSFMTASLKSKFGFMFCGSIPILVAFFLFKGNKKCSKIDARDIRRAF